MTANRRIFLNIVATYGRSLYALVIGLFTARWVLQALGQVDYGLYGVVAGLVAFISFFNGLLAGAVGRFYAISVGKASVSKDKGTALDECHKWFSSAVFLHTLIPTILIIIGYPVGVWTVKNFLTIPADRINDCVWVFRFVCVTCYLTMISVPVNAMYTAKQYIAELTVYSFVTTTFNFGFVYYMITHPEVWLAKYAFWMCMLGVLPQVIIAIRGFYLFKECRLKLQYCVSFERFKQLLYFVGWWSFGCFGVMLRNQGVQILVNKSFGPNANASMSIANNVNGHTMMLSGAMTGAFQPAIVTACGAGDYNRMRMLAYRACKFSVLFILIFMLPLALELREVLRLWLVNPPDWCYGLCMIMFVMTVVDQSAVGHMLAVNAMGKIAMYQSVLGCALLASLPLAWLFCALGLNLYWVAVALLITMSICSWGRVWFARSLAGMSVWYWLKKIMVPIAWLTAIVTIVGYLPHCFMRESLLRIIVTTAICEAVFLPLIWLILLEKSERQFVVEKLRGIKMFKRF